MLCFPVTISKLYKDGTEEVVYDDHNVIVSGMGVGLALMFSLSGSQSIIDYQLDRFQIGVSGRADNDDPGQETSAVFELSGPLSSLAEYGGNSSKLFLTDTDKQLKVGDVSPTAVYGRIPFSKVTRIDETSVRYTIVIDENSCNDLERPGNPTRPTPLSEIGLFMKNPIGLSPDTSVLVAYRSFSAIPKTSDFSLIFRWTINL